MPSRITKRGKVRWQARVQKNGQIRQKTCTTKKEALDWESEQREADWLTPTDSCNLIDWANKYLDFAGAKYTVKTYKEKKAVFRQLFQAIDPKLPTDKLKPGQALDYLQSQALGRSGHAANKDRKNLVAAWNWGMKYLDLPGPNPFLVDRFPEKRHPRYVPPEEDFWKVLEVAEGQDQVMLKTFLYLAARRSEIFNLTWDDVDFVNKRVRLWTKKRAGGHSESDWLPMCEVLKKTLTKWWAERPIKTHTHVFLCLDENAFTSEYFGQPFKERRHLMKRLCIRAGVKPFGFHAIRHLTASILYGQGQTVSAIQAVLRHQNPNTTSRYLRKLGLEQTRKALDSLNTRGPAKVIEIKNHLKAGTSGG